MKVLKKVLLGALSLACVATASVGLVGCRAGKDGKDGKDGKSAYEIWLANGYSGTEADFLDWLKADGTTQAQEGTDGLAYYPLPDGTYAVAQGNTMYLEEIVIPSTYKGKVVTALVDNAFSGAKVKSITIPDSVTSIGNHAFYDCSSLTSVVIGNSVTSMGDYAFYNCSSLTSVVIPDSVTSIASSAFNGCDSLQYNVKGELNYLGNKSSPYIYLAGSEDKSIVLATIEESCKFIGSSAFSSCNSLTSVVIPDNVTSIGDGAFSSCSSLTSVVIPDSVTSIGGGAFSSCSSLTSVVIPDNVTSIGSFAFYGCDSLQYNVKGELNYLGNKSSSYIYLAGSEDKSIVSATIEESCKFIGSSAFSSCNSLTSVVIPDNVTSIGDGAFSSCSSLTSVVIPDSVTEIGSYAFYYCRSLTRVYYKGSANDWNNVYIYSLENNYLTNATRYYYSESQPTEEGNYWHYDENGEVAVW